MATSTNNKMLTNPQSKNIVLREAVSLDAPPLDFSYKNIKDLSDMKTMDPRGGKRKPITIEMEEAKRDKKNKKDSPEVKQEPTDKEKDEKAQVQQPGNEATGEATGDPAQGNNENQKPDEKNEKDDKEKEKEQENSKDNKDKDKEKEKKEENQNQQPAQQNLKKGLEVIRIIPQNNITNTIAAHNIVLNNTNTKNMVGKNFEETNIYSQKKVVAVKLVCTSLILSYNEIRALDGFHHIIDAVMYDCHNLAWIDLSHNYLVTLNYNFKDFPYLRTLYLHCNYIKDLKELLNFRECQNLKSLTIHGNPVETISNFRIYIIGLLPQLKKIDTVLVSKKERDNAFVWMNSFKNINLPEVKGAAKPPEIVQNQPDQK